MSGLDNASLKTAGGAQAGTWETPSIANLALDSPWKLVLLTVTLVVFIHAIKALYQGLSGPLAKIPGPLLSKFSDWPLRIATSRGEKIFYIDALHAQYGPCVRISPTEISISDIASAKEIHRIGAHFNKAEWYGKFQPGSMQESEKGIFAMIDPKIHAARRKLFANAFSKNALVDWEDVLQQKVRLTIQGIKGEVRKKGKANVLDWFTYMANDIIATLSFGDSFKTLEKGEKTQFVKDLQAVMMFNGMSVELPWLRPILTLLQPNRRVQETAKAALAQSRESGTQAQGGKNTTLFAKMVASGDSQELSLPQIEREATNFIVAGSDTTAVTLTYLVYAVLAFDADIRRKLEKELATLETGFRAQEAAALPYLSCVIQETLRLYGAAPGSLPRTVPPGGRMLGGHYLPAGTTVSTQAYTLHRDPVVFPEPDKFKPERWQSPTQEMKDAFMPYGGGVRVCIAIHLATWELALGAATFFREFPTAKLASETTEESMRFENYFLVAPKSHACFVTL